MDQTYVPDFRALLASGRFLVGTWLTILDPVVAELLAGSGWDFLVADGEHGQVAADDLVRFSIATRAAGVPLLYRVGANEPVRIMQALDGGASGVVVPQIRTVADVERAVAWCRYPPLGSRGVAPRRVSGYGRQAGEYMASANELVTCCIQIETRESLEGLDALLAVPGVDAILVGPNDLAASIGHTGDLGHPDVEAAIARVLERAVVAGVPAGIWTPSVSVTLRRREQGYRFTTIGADYGFIVSAADGTVREVRAGG
ncbi:MAG TPA: aldolase/citrate lyase family protein [Candidatus Limnocylindrales bacterium]